MIALTEFDLHYPIELNGTRYDRLAVTSYTAIANFNTAAPERIILSLSKVFGVPRRVIRHLHPSDAVRAGDLIRDLLDEAALSFR